MSTCVCRAASLLANNAGHEQLPWRQTGHDNKIYRSRFVPVVAAASSSVNAKPASDLVPFPQSFVNVPETLRPKRAREEIKIDTATEDVHAFWDYNQLFASQRAEVTTPIKLKVVEGAIPADLNGSYYLCGPGMRSDDHGSCVSPLDGHGYLRKFAFTHNSVHYSARYVKTDALEDEFDEELKTWRFSYRGPFSLLRHGPRIGNFKVMKNVANTSVLKWGGKLMCLWEGGEPYEMNEESLETIGNFRLPLNKIVANGETDEQHESSNKLRDVALDVCTKGLLPILTGGFNMPLERVLAHFKIDEKRQRLVVITSNAEDMLLPKATFSAYEFDTNLNLVQRREFLLHDHLMVHDWALTDEHYVILGNRINLDTASSMTAMAGLSPMISCLSVDESTPFSPMYLLPRFSKTTQRDWRIPAMIPGQLWLTHAANAYEETIEGGRVTRFVLDACVSSYKWFSLQNMFGYNWQERLLDPRLMNNIMSSSQTGDLESPHMVRISVEVNNIDSTMTPNVQQFRNANFTTDFPVINSRLSGCKNEFTYVASNSGCRKDLTVFPMDCISKLHGPSGKVSSWWAGHRCFVGEPHFVPRRSLASQPEEDDGYIMAIQYSVADNHRYMVILDAQLIGTKDALVAKLEVPKEYHFPLGFHGFWEEDSIEDMAPSRVSKSRPSIYKTQDAIAT